MMLARGRDNESAMGQRTVPACWRDDELVAGRRGVLACSRDGKSAAGQKMVLARGHDNGIGGRADDGALALAAIPCSLVRQQDGG